MDYGMFLPVQQAAVAAVMGDQSCVEATRKAYQRRRDLLCEGFSSIGWNMEKPSSTMFVWAPVPPTYTSSEAFVLALLEKAGVLVTPGSAFGPSGEGFVRLALVQDEVSIQKAVAAVQQAAILVRSIFIV